MILDMTINGHDFVWGYIRGMGRTVILDMTIQGHDFV